MTERKDDLDSMECDSLLYGALASLLSDERSEAIDILSLLVEKLKRGDGLSSEDIISVACSFMDDLAELGVFDDDELTGDDLVEFEIKTFKDEDPKKRLN